MDFMMNPAIGIVGMVFLFPVLLLVLFLLFILALVKIFRGGSKRREDSEMREEVDNLWALADRIEKRVENLETILAGRSHADRAER